MVFQAKPADKYGSFPRLGEVAAGLARGAGWALLAACAARAGVAQAPAGTAGPGAGAAFTAAADATADPGAAWAGQTVRSIAFEGVAADRLKGVADRLPEAVGAPFNTEGLRQSLRLLYATGLYENIEVTGAPAAGGVALTFRGAPRMFIGTVDVEGAKGATVNAQLTRASQLTPGSRFSQAKLDRAIEQMRAALAENGFHTPTITPHLTPHAGDQLTDIAFQVVSGAQARVGAVAVAGDCGMSVNEFRRHARLRGGAHVDRDTVNRALDGVLKHYQKQERLEADVKLEAEQYDAAAGVVNFSFSATRGPVVKVLVEGAEMDAERTKRLIPIFEEGSVDEDLLNEGNRRLRDYYQRLGYFDVKVSHEEQPGGPELVTILFHVQLGPRRRVERVTVTGNRYFDTPTLAALLSVRPADTLDRQGIYSQALVSADVNALAGVYQNNGFAGVKVAPEISSPPPEPGKRVKTAPLDVNYRIEEGRQMKVGAVRIEGNAHIEAAKLTPLLNTAPGQLLSPQNLAGDRDALLTQYMSQGFEQAAVEVSQQAESGDPNTVDVAFRVTEGDQVFVRNVLTTGLHFTRPETVTRAVTVRAGEPLNQTALQDTQRNLYELALFNEVNTAVQNPAGSEPYKTILLQTSEARRWALTYGFGFEAQTGQPQNNCRGASLGGVPCNPNGKTGVSPRVLANITRNNLFGREQSASLQATSGLLEQSITALYQIPHFEGNRNFSFAFSGSYANSQDVTTYVAARLQGGMRWTENFNTPGSFLSKANTFIYELNFRRVKVAASSLQVYPNEIEELATAVRVSGPSFTWVRDTRDSALDAHRGTYTSFQEFLSDKMFGSQAEFNRLDLTNSSYYGFDKDRFVVARNTRYGQIRSFGTGSSQLIPLPERLYAGGPISLRGFSQNAAGPRDPETGFPIGGAGALINSVELRLPPPNLPWFGNTLSFVLFHDMGNVFTNAGDAWISALRIHQPDRDACKTLTYNDPSPVPTGPTTSTGVQGQCNFNYFSHAPGLGLRYHTPVGPIRLDFSYNLNPPIFPINIDYSATPYDYSNPHVGRAGHLNFFFSLGQTF